MSNLIFYNVNGQLRVRKCPAKVRNPRSPKQTAQRTRVKGIADLYALLDDQIYYNWKALAEGTTANGYNLFMSHNIRNLNAEGKIADPAKLCLAQGGLYTPQWVNTEMTAEGKMVITWDTTEGEERTSYCDRLLIAVHTIRDTLELEEIMVVDETMVERSTGPGTRTSIRLFQGAIYQRRVGELLSRRTNKAGRVKDFPTLAVLLFSHKTKASLFLPLRGIEMERGDEAGHGTFHGIDYQA